MVWAKATQHWHFWAMVVCWSFCRAFAAVGCFYQATRFPAFQANTMMVAGVGALLATLVLGYGSTSESGYKVLGTLSPARFALWGIPDALRVAGMP